MAEQDADDDIAFVDVDPDTLGAALGEDAAAALRPCPPGVADDDPDAPPTQDLEG